MDESKDIMVSGGSQSQTGPRNVIPFAWNSGKEKSILLQWSMVACSLD